MVAHYPKTLLEALVFLKDYKRAKIVSGGTDIMVKSINEEYMIFLNRVEELKKVTEEDGILKIGSECTYTELINNENIPDILKKAMRQIAAPAIRNSGTLSGNICNASPAGDSLPVLYALCASIETQYINEEGNIEINKTPIEDFIVGIRKISLKEGAIVTAIEIPIKNYCNISRISYEKVGARKAQAISKVSFIGLLKEKEEKITDIKVAFGSISTKVVRIEEIEKEIVGLTIDELDNKKEEFINKYLKFITPINDQRSTAQYRKKVCENLLREFLSKEGKEL